MNKCINFYGFLQYLFDDKKQAKQAAAIHQSLVRSAIATSDEHF